MQTDVREVLAKALQVAEVQEPQRGAVIALFSAAIKSSATSPEETSKAGRGSVTLTARQIRNAAQWAVPDGSDDDALDSEWVIGYADPGPSDTREELLRGWVMWMAEYPEEGSLPLDCEDDAALAASPQVEPMAQRSLTPAEDSTLRRALVRGAKLVNASPKPAQAEPEGCHGLDTPERVRFYEHDFYVLSNFSAFSLKWQGRRFPTSEHAYHWEKFEPGTRNEQGLYVRDRILEAQSAHDAFKMAEAWKPLRRADWDAVKVDIMRGILREKVRQHEYVRRKLLATGDRELVEDSWRDDFWGWGPNRDGKNMLGRLWMEIRAELLAAAPKRTE